MAKGTNKRKAVKPKKTRSKTPRKAHATARKGQRRIVRGSPLGPRKTAAKAPRKDSKTKAERKAELGIVRFNMEVHRDELKKYKAAAETAGMSMSEWARQALLKASTK